MANQPRSGLKLETLKLQFVAIYVVICPQAGRAFTLKPVSASTKGGENKPIIISAQKIVLDQHIQHLRRCAIIGAYYPPVTPAAIHIQVLRTWRIYRRYRHNVALLMKELCSYKDFAAIQLN